MIWSEEREYSSSEKTYLHDIENYNKREGYMYIYKLTKGGFYHLL